jgi:ketosteroid isomerase-like protein
MNAESDAVKIVRRGYEAFNSGDFDAAVELMQPDIEWMRAERAPEPEPLRGVEAIREWMKPDVFEEQRVDLVEVIEHEDKVFVEGKFRIRARGSGIEMEDTAFHVWTIRDGKAARMDFYDNRSEALEAAGLEPGVESASQG